MGSERVRHDWATNSFTVMADLQCGLVSAYIRVTQLHCMHIPFHILFRYGCHGTLSVLPVSYARTLLLTRLTLNSLHPLLLNSSLSLPLPLSLLAPRVFCVRGRCSDDQPFLAGLHAQSLSRVQLFCDPMNAHQAPLSMEFPRQEYWSGFPFPPPGDLPDPGIRPVSPVSPALQADSLLLSHRGSNEFSKLIQTEYP